MALPCLRNREMNILGILPGLCCAHKERLDWRGAAKGRPGANGSEGVWKPSPEEGKEGGRTSSFEERSADGPETGAIAQLNPGTANEEFVGILEPKGFLSRFVSSEAMREGARPTADCLLRSSSDLRGR
jgi:hypothetical protein